MCANLVLCFNLLIAVEGNSHSHNSTMDMVPKKAAENVSTALELKDLSNTKVKSVATKLPQPLKTNEAWLHVSSEYLSLLCFHYVRDQ